MAGPNLARMIGEPERTVQLRQAVVSAVSASGGTISVKLGNSATAIDGVRRLSSSSIVVNDVVWVLQQGYDLLALGRVADAAYGTQGMSDGLELYHPASTPYIDFHRAANPAGDGGADYDMRLINDATDRLSVTGGALHIDGVWIRGNGGRNYFKDSEKNDGTGLRVGAAWNRYGIYSENGDVTIGAATNRISLQGDGLGWIDSNGFNTGRAYQGLSGAHGGSWAQWSHASYWNSSAHYGYMHNGGTVLLSADDVRLRYQNSDRFFADANAVNVVNSRFVLNSNRVDTRGYGDDWHCFQWWSGNDGWRATEYGGFYFRVVSSDPALEIRSSGTSKFHRFDQIGAYDTAAIMTHSSGGGTGAKVGYWSAGQNAAHIHKCWGSSIEVRNWDDGGWGYSVGDFNDVSTLRAKLPGSIERMKDKLPKAARRAKHKKIQGIKYKRPLEDACVNCAATGKKAGRPDLLEKERGLMVAAAMFGAELEDCPDCGGSGKKTPDAGAQKNYDTGLFGFAAEELAEEFPEVVFFDRDGLPVAVKPNALIALLWEDNKDQQEEIDDLEARIAALEKKG